MDRTVQDCQRLLRHVACPIDKWVHQYAVSLFWRGYDLKILPLKHVAFKPAKTLD